MKIKSIRLKNFLSFGWEQTIQFNDGMNVIVGPNDSGKTNLFRALTFVSTIFSRKYEGLLSLLPYFHHGNYGEPVEIEVAVEFSAEEMDYLYTFMMISSLTAIYNEGDNHIREVKKNLLMRHGRRLFCGLFQSTSLFVKLQSKQDFPASPIICIKNGEQKLWIHSYGSVSLNEIPRTSGQPRNIPQLLYEHFTSANISEQVYEPPSLFDLIQSLLKVNSAQLLDIGGFNFHQPPIGSVQDALTKEDFLRFDKFQSFISQRKGGGANLFDTVETIYSTSIVRIANTRCIPANPVLTDKTLSESEVSHYHLLSGQDLPVMLYRMKNSLDQEQRKALEEIRKYFRKTMDNADFDVIIRPSKVKVPHEEIVANTMPFGSQSPVITNDRYMAVRSVDDEKVAYELVISFIKEDFIVPLELAAAGMFEALYILATIVYHKGKVLMLDEPASNLHPNMQRKVLDLLKGYTVGKNQNQVIMVTHSPYLIESNMPENIWRFAFSNGRGTVLARITDSLKDLEPEEKQHMLKNLENTEIRSILFSRGIVLVEGISDRLAVQEVDRYLSAAGTGANIANNEWSIIGMGGKGGLQSFLDLARRFGIPTVAVVDYEALMRITGHIDSESGKIKTSAVFIGLERFLNKDDIAALRQLESSVIPRANKKGNIEHWYKHESIERINEIALSHSVWVLTGDLEDILQNPTTQRESKPLKAMEWINKMWETNFVPEEFKNLNTYLKDKLKYSSPY